jgi:predicted SAM-dependent methyltransferase
MNQITNKLINKTKSISSEIYKFFNFLKNYKKNKQIFILKKQINGLKIHIGSGLINLQGWINVDARNFTHIHLVTDNLELKEFSDDAVAEIYLCHVLEHLSFEEAQFAINIFFKKLKKGGTVRISVPNFESIIDVYRRNNNNIETIQFALMGGQDYPYNFHKSVYDSVSLRKLLAKSGFSLIKEWSTNEDFGVDVGDWSSASFHTLGKSVPISLNLKAYKP